MTLTAPAPRTSRIAGAQRAAAVFGRNAAAARHPSYLWVLLSGLFEPVFFLLSIGLGVGSLVGTVQDGGQSLRYADYVAPAMLAASVMNGAVSESVFNFFTKLRMMRLHDATACTPVSAGEMVFGEVLWSVLRGMVHSVPFLCLTSLLGLVAAERLPGLFLATVLTGAAFGALGIAVSTFVRATSDFDRVNLVTYAMFVFSGTFAPVSGYPGPLAAVCQAIPLWQAVTLCRELAFGRLRPETALHVLYLAALAVAAWSLAARRMEATLRV
ncbi:ABC transporter permease [Streptomyces sp. NPDC028722]|uniref:ABC transporter permease n=1 Tax=Streptomyces sp. NPDC028722 TaxID=3155016 RepID=UPI0033DD8975